MKKHRRLMKNIGNIQYSGARQTKTIKIRKKNEVLLWSYDRKILTGLEI
jgi:hypothetical protein